MNSITFVAASECPEGNIGVTQHTQRTPGKLRSWAAKGLVALRGTYLLPHGHVIPFLEPYWKEKEIETGLNWVSDNKPKQLDQKSIEARFLDATRQHGIAVATSSGRTALSLALRALKGMRPDRNEVIIPSYSCLALLDAVLYSGLSPIYADVGYDLNLTEPTVSPLLTKKTLAVVVVHLGGNYVNDTEVIRQKAEQNGAVAIEDLCQALGGKEGERHWESEAPMAIYSFGLGKNLMATAGGMLVARTALDSILIEKLKLNSENATRAPTRFSYIMKAHYRKGTSLLFPRPPMPVLAFQSSYEYNRMDLLDVQLLDHQLYRMDEIVQVRRRNANTILTNLGSSVKLRTAGKEDQNVWTKFIVLADNTQNAYRMRKMLTKSGIETETMYTPLHLRKEGARYSRGVLPVTEEVYTRVFNLPVRPSLSAKEILYIAKTTKRLLARIERTNAK